MVIFIVVVKFGNHNFIYTVHVQVPENNNIAKEIKL